MLTNYLRTGTAASTYLPLTGGTLSINSSTNYVASANDNANLTLYNSSSNATNTIYNGLKFFVGAADGAIAGGEGQANIYAIRRGSNLPGTDLSFILKGAGVNENEMLERLRIKFDGKVGIGTSAPNYLLDVNGQIGSTGFIKSGGLSSQFLKANGDVDSSTYLTTGSAASTYLPLTGGTLSGDLGISKSSNSILRLSSADVGSYGKLIFSSNNGSFLNYGASIESSGDGVGVDVGSLNFLTGFGTVRTNRMTITPSGNLSIINSATIGGTLGVTGAISSESILLPYNKSSGFSQFSLFQNANSFVISGGTGGIQFNNNNNSNALVKIFNNGNFKISNNQTDNGYKFEVDGTTGLQGTLTVNSSAVFNEGSAVADFRVESDNNANMLFVDGTNNRVGIGYASPTKTLDVNGEVRINTVTATPSSLLGKDGSNVVGEVTTVAQTGLMTRGETTATTGSPSAIFTVTHGLGFNPSSVIVTSAGIGGGNKILFEVYTKNSTTFSVQAWNLDGTEAASKEVKIYWLAIK
jgi:hypothetical protein